MGTRIKDVGTLAYAKKVLEMLTEIECKNLKPKDGKIYRIANGKGLFLEVHHNGSKYWRFRYRHAGKEKLLGLGVYPEESLKEAGGKRDDLRKILKEGEDPSALRKKERIETKENAINTFKKIALEYIGKKEHILAKSY